jgi:hypothetical protein
MTFSPVEAHNVSEEPAVSCSDGCCYIIICFLHGLFFSPQDEAGRNVGELLPDHTASYPGR